MNLKDNYTLLCIDASSASTGFAIVTNKYTLVDYGTIPNKRLDTPERLLKIESKITELIEKYKPDYVCCEQMFVGSNRQTGMVLGNVHGVILLTCAKYNLPVTYFSVMTAKSTVMGGIKTKKSDGTKKTGDEMKEEVKNEILNIFNISSLPGNDISDAVSIGVTFIRLEGEPPKKIKKKKKKKE